MPITLPTVHLNGTGRETLREGYSHALGAVRNAIFAIEKIEFHSRDYYPTPGVFMLAARERGIELENLRKTEAYLVEIYMHLLQ